MDTKPQNPVASIKCYDLMAYKVFMEEVCHIKFGGGSFDWKVKVLAPILRLKSDRWVAIPPSQAFFFPIASDQIFR